jgi:hypothetical protein
VIGRRQRWCVQFLQGWTKREANGARSERPEDDLKHGSGALAVGTGGLEASERMP